MLHRLKMISKIITEWSNRTMKRYLKTNDYNWKRLIKKEIEAEQQEMQLDASEQIKFNIEGENNEKRWI